MGKLKHRMTNEELAHWLVLGRGQCKIHKMVMCEWHYPFEDTNAFVPQGVTIKPWGSKLWDEPYTEGITIKEISND